MKQTEGEPPSNKGISLVGKDEEQYCWTQSAVVSSSLHYIDNVTICFWICAVWTSEPLNKSIYKSINPQFQSFTIIFQHNLAYQWKHCVHLPSSNTCYLWEGWSQQWPLLDTYLLKTFFVQKMLWSQ